MIAVQVSEACQSDVRARVVSFAGRRCALWYVQVSRDGGPWVSISPPRISKQEAEHWMESM